MAALRHWYGFVALLLAALAAQGASPGDAEFAALQALQARARAPWQAAGSDGELRDTRTPGPRERALWRAERSRRVHRAGLAFYDTHPDDPRRWEALATIVMADPDFTLDVDESVFATDPRRATRRDEAAAAAWAAQLESLTDTALASEDIGEGPLAKIVFKAIERDQARLSEDAPRLLASLARRVAALDRRAMHVEPKSVWVTNAYMFYAQCIEEKDPTGRIELLRRLTASHTPRLSEWATGLLNVEEARTKPVELKFVALDGRGVDLAKLRGKVVLLDFWAMWCAPCVAEMPRMKEIHEKFRARGFETIGIVIDAEKDREKLIAFCAKNGVAWPQHFDGKAFAGKFATQMGVRGLPTLLLLDREGRIASTRARGEALEGEIEKQLSR